NVRKRFQDYPCGVNRASSEEQLPGRELDRIAIRQFDCVDDDMIGDLLEPFYQEALAIVEVPVFLQFPHRVARMINRCFPRQEEILSIKQVGWPSAVRFGQNSQSLFPDSDSVPAKEGLRSWPLRTQIKCPRWASERHRRK